MKTRTWPYGTTRRARVIECTPMILTVEDDQNEGHLIVGTGHNPHLTQYDIGTLTFTQGGPFGGFWVFEPDLPILYLDPSLPKNRNYAVHPDTGEPWEERDRDLQTLAMAARDPDDDTSASMFAALREATVFEYGPAMMCNTFFYGYDVKPGIHPQRCYSTHPDNIAGWTDEQKSKYDIREWPQFNPDPQITLDLLAIRTAH